MTTATTIIDILTSGYNSAVTFYGGYAVNPKGVRKLFEPAHVATERRNKAGRVTFGRYEYTDGSAIEIHYHVDRGPTFKAV